MKTRKILFSAFFLLLAVTMLFSCGKETGKDEESGIKAPDYFEFTIIRGDTSANEVSSAAVTLQKALEAASGREVKLGTDYTGFTKETEFEILIGITKREASKNYSKLSPKSFVIDYVGSKIVIIGGTNADTVEAVNYFIENYLEDSENAITLASGEKYEYAFDYPDLIVNGKNMSEYTIVNTDRFASDFLAELRDRIESVFGYEMPLTDSAKEKNLFVSIDESLGEGKYKNYADGDALYITGADGVALGSAFDEFVKLIPTSAEEGETVEIDISVQGRTEPSILEDIEANTNTAKYFIVNTDKDALDYKVGETIKFDIMMVSGDELRSCPLFKWTISPEGGEAVSGVSSGGTGRISLEAKMDMPGFVLVTVQACDADGNVIEGVDKCSVGACADMENLKVAAEEPDDWEEFWKSQLARLDEVDPVAMEMTEDGSNSSYYIYDVKVDCLGNEKWTGETYSAIYVSVPKNADPQSLGIYVKFMGAGVRSTETHLSKKEDYICVSVNGHSISSKMGEEYYSNLSATTLKSYAKPKADETDPAEVFYSYMVMRDLQALRWVKSYFGAEGEDLWDGETLEVSGMSEGGFQALFTAALDQDVSYCTADVPAMCDKQGVNIGRKSSYGASVETMLYYDTCFFARRIKCPVKIMVGLGDVTCCPSGITAMYNELTCEREIVYVQNMGHTYPDSAKIQERFTFSEIADH
ncbi:MAG: acetylxylan esterase [Clostridia bacterium]|nr:acetylxylan esterase [Clostridia bacterium]